MATKLDDELAELAPYSRQDEANTTTPPGVAPAKEEL
jgi:hypothetical protein